jgi:CHASE2 domain-containing sensor protein
LEKDGRYGINDIIVDGDGVVRRGLLFFDDGENVFYSFGLVLALSFLAEKGVAPRPDTANPQNIRLGPATVVPFEKKRWMLRRR